MTSEIYDDLPNAMGDLEVGVDILETMILNGGNQKANRHLADAIQEMKRALSDMSDAEFEIATSPVEFDGEDGSAAR